MPIRELTVYAEALPDVQARDSMRQAEAIGVGSGAFKEGARRDIAGRWKGAIRQATAKRPQTPEQLQAAAAASGLAFVRVPAPKPKDPA